MEDLQKINLQKKTQALPGRAEKYWFENEHVGIKKTLFHQIEIPLKPFDSGLDYEEQPVKTLIVIDWLNLGLEDPTDLDGVEISSARFEDVEASVYVGWRHNPCVILDLKLSRKDGNLYEVKCELLVEFEYEIVGANEKFSFETEIEFFPDSTSLQESLS